VNIYPAIPDVVFGLGTMRWANWTLFTLTVHTYASVWIWVSENQPSETVRKVRTGLKLRLYESAKQGKSTISRP
jgi:hypothetical protein